jgi:hypothetical protein
MGDTRLEMAAALLVREGLSGLDVEVLGHEGDVLAVAAPASAQPALAVLAPRLKELGFRYIALDLERTAG